MTSPTSTTSAAAAATAPVTNVPPLDLPGQYRQLQPEIDAAVRRVFETGAFVLGPDVQAFEAEFAAAHGVAAECCVGCNSGTDALILALQALGIGAQSGGAATDEVITTPYSYMATAAAIVRVGARPVFVDIDAATFNLRVDRIESAITPRTRAIMPVHLFGQAADMPALMAVAQRHRVPVIEDAAQAQGATALVADAGGNGSASAKLVGTVGDIGCYSFYPTKNLGAAGDAGAVIARDPATATRIRALRQHGTSDRITHHWAGMNSRLDSLQAAVLRVKLPHVPDWIERRRAVADAYRMAFAARPKLAKVALPVELPTGKHSYNQFVVRITDRDRDAVLAGLKQAGVGAAVYYLKGMHTQPVLEPYGFTAADHPEAERATRESLALPMHPDLTAEQIERVVTVLEGLV